MIRLSREKARREEAWSDLEKSFNNNERVNGVIFGRVKGGFIVDLSGAVAFLPGSQVDIRPVRDASSLMGVPQPFQILKMDAQRNNIVVSRRAVLLNLFKGVRWSTPDTLSDTITNLQKGGFSNKLLNTLTDIDNGTDYMEWYSRDQGMRNQSK